MALKKKKIFKRENIADIAANLDISPDSYSSCPLIEICGDREVFISGCGALLEYGNEIISFESSLGIITVQGTFLTISGFSDGHMTVNGKINSVLIGERND